MKEFEGTPGPWSISRLGFEHGKEGRTKSIRAADGRYEKTVAQMATEGFGELEANIVAIAAVPDMIAALKPFAEKAEDMLNVGWHLSSELRAALASYKKAVGDE